MTNHADQDKLTQIAQKIAALGEKTEEHGATPAEVEAATLMIQKLLTKYNLSLEYARSLSGAKQISADDIVIQMTLNHSDRRFEWELNLAHNIARGFYCQVTYFRLGYHFIGTATDARVAIQTFNRLRAMLALMATQATKEYTQNWRDLGVLDTRQLKGAHSVKSYKLSYLNGVVAGIGAKLQEQQRSHQEITALIVVRDTAIEAKKKERWGKLRNMPESNSQHNSDAWKRGHADGKNVTIARGELSVDN